TIFLRKFRDNSTHCASDAIHRAHDSTVTGANAAMRGLSRGLQVLEFITRKRGATFTEVRLGTGLSKSVVHRILAELADSGYVWRGVAEGKYYASGVLARS